MPPYTWYLLLNSLTLFARAALYDPIRQNHGWTNELQLYVRPEGVVSASEAGGELVEKTPATKADGNVDVVAFPKYVKYGSDEERPTLIAAETALVLVKTEPVVIPRVLRKAEAPVPALLRTDPAFVAAYVVVPRNQPAERLLAPRPMPTTEMLLSNTV
jgi:hypothetical protein